MKVLKEEKKLRERLHELMGINAQLVGKQITALVIAAREDEREECAKLIDDYDNELVLSGRKIPFRFYTKKIAVEIRRRKCR